MGRQPGDIGPLRRRAGSGRRGRGLVARRVSRSDLGDERSAPAPPMRRPPRTASPTRRVSSSTPGVTRAPTGGRSARVERRATPPPADDPGAARHARLGTPAPAADSDAAGLDDRGAGRRFEARHDLDGSARPPPRMSSLAAARLRAGDVHDAGVPRADPDRADRVGGGAVGGRRPFRIWLAHRRDDTVKSQSSPGTWCRSSALMLVGEDVGGSGRDELDLLVLI